MANREVKRTVMSKAWKLVKTLGLSLSEALKKAWLQVKLSRHEFFKIQFVKKDGTITERVGSNAKLDGDTVLFFSITDNGFRKALIGNILNIKQAEVQIQIS